MFGLKKHKDTSKQVLTDELGQSPKKGLFGKFKSGLKKTRAGLGASVNSLFKSHLKLDDKTKEALESYLLSADVSLEATEHLLDSLKEHVKDSEDLKTALKKACVEMLVKSEVPLEIDSNHKPYVMLFVGINGAGKTTTIGKIAKILQQQGLKVLLAAGDTFRAAAIEQLTVWGERNDIPVVAQSTGSDSASVIFDALSSAKARGIDVVLCDTAGRLHTQANLMEELKKIERVVKKFDESAPHELMLVLDAGIGQNAIVQAKEFSSAVDVSGITMTKLDGTAKGGVVFSVASDLSLPLRFVGLGEGIDDLKEFKAQDFVDALFDEDNT